MVQASPYDDLPGHVDAKLTEVFKKTDSNNDGYQTKDEVRKALMAMRDARKWAKIVEADKNGDKAVTFEEYSMAFIKHLPDDKDVIPRNKKRFALMDGNG